MNDEIKKECKNCMDDIKESTEKVLSEITHNFKVQSAKMQDDWIMFMVDANKQLTANIEASTQKIDKESSERNSNSRWVLGIVLGVTFMLGAVVGFTWNEVSNKADRSEVFTMNEIKMLRELGDQYNKSIFIMKDTIKNDTTAYWYARKNIYGSSFRGGSSWFKEDYDKTKNETN